ncbi:hypothetical protein [Enterobacter cloacae]|uniref:hypothetical protein n=1 Tax=Enterobacter cloacae TaxID=550 RepID=UPI00214BFDAE|nr:hypothetical protein [Enterobacter cloacae]
MSTITKEWLQKAISQYEIMRDESPDGLNEYDSNELAALRIALASLEAEAVGEVVLGEYDDCGCHPDARVVCIAADGQADWENFKDGARLYTAHPAPVSVPDLTALDNLAGEMLNHAMNCERRVAVAYTHCAHRLAEEVRDLRAAMLQGAENAESTTTMKTAPALDSSPKIAESTSGINQGKSEPVTTAYKLPPHIYRELVNRLRDTAVKYQGCQQLREQLSRTLQEVIQPAAPQQEVKS